MYKLANRLDRDWPRFSGASPLFADLERWFHDADRFFEAPERALPTFNTQKTEGGYSVSVDVPGLSDKDITLDVHNQVLTLSGSRVSDPPEGYSATRRERQSLKFSQSIRLPEDVDAEKVSASIKHGVLTVSLGKRDEVKPRQIKVEAS